MTRRRRSDTVWMIVMLVISGNPAVYPLAGGEENLLPIVAAVLGFAVVARRARVFQPRVLWVTAALVGIQLVQCYEFQFWPVVTILGMVTRLFIAAAVVALVEDFPAVYVRAITIVATYCLAMWVLDQTALALRLDFRGLFAPIEQAIGLHADHRFALVYTFSILHGSYRNAGFFREPGLFAGYLLLGLLWLMLDRRGVAPRASSLGASPQGDSDPSCAADRDRAITARVRRRRIVVVLAALLTTFSTAGYVTIPVVLAAVAFEHGERIKRVVSRKAMFVAVLVVSLGGLWLVSKNTTFLEDKIQSQYEEVVDETANYETARFGAALLDLEAIEERPYLGWGLHESTKFAEIPEFAQLSPSGGVTGWARSFGIVGVVVFLLAIWAGLRPLVSGSLAASIYATAAIAVIAQPNTFLNYPTFLALMFLRRPPERHDQVVAGPERART